MINQSLKLVLYSSAKIELSNSVKTWIWPNARIAICLQQ